MIIVTGGAGFIGSAIVWKLNNEGRDDIVVVDNLGCSMKWKNLVPIKYMDYLHKDRFLTMIEEDKAILRNVEAIIHMGACSSTTERNADYLAENNYRYSRIIAEWTASRNVRFIYASSAATYGQGSLGFSDDDETTKNLYPINMYGYSKQFFDLWILRNEKQRSCVGMKYFNVYGPNEYHKEDMRSVIHKAYGQIKDHGSVRLFKSYQREYPDGGQMRDFVYVKDCADVVWWFLENKTVNGIYNLGTGKARTWNDLAKAVFMATGRKERIEYIEMPAEVKNQYQYWTEARMGKLQNAGYDVAFHTLEEGIEDYVKNYLDSDEAHLGCEKNL